MLTGFLPLFLTKSHAAPDLQKQPSLCCFSCTAGGAMPPMPRSAMQRGFFSLFDGTKREVAGLGGQLLGRCCIFRHGHKIYAIVWRKHFRAIVVSCCVHIPYRGAKELLNFRELIPFRSKGALPAQNGMRQKHGRNIVTSSIQPCTRHYPFNLASLTTFKRWERRSCNTRCRSYCNYEFCRS